MDEFLEFRLPEDRAREAFGADAGDPVTSWIRRFELPINDPSIDRIAAIDRAWRERGKSFLLSWSIRRVYSGDELNRVELLLLEITSSFEPAGEECGTEYDYSAVCSHCGAGRSRSSPLRLNLRRIPRSKDITQSIAGDEWIVSSRLAEAIRQNRFSGVQLEPVQHAREASVGDGVWYQLTPVSAPVTVASSTSFGIHPFDPDTKGQYRCPLGHVLGLNLLSEPALKRDTWDGSDIASTRELVGIRRGLLVPRPLLLVSHRFYKMLLDEKMKGWRVQRALLV